VVTATNETNSASTTTLVIVELPIEGLTAENDSPTVLSNTTHLTASVVAGSDVIYAWNFGDGTLGSGEGVTHTYPSVGFYTATVTASNSISLASTVTLVSIIPACEPAILPEFSWLPLDPISGNLVTFTGNGVGSEPITYTWGFGDGAVGMGITTTHTYADGGDYTVVLTAANACGEASTEHTVTVTQACQPVELIDFTWLPAEPVGSEVITFTGFAEGSAPISFTWNFGDGAAGTGSTTTHSYADPGIYTVALSATNACSTDQSSTQITILQKVWEFFLPMITR
jgi:PKD repeat protein